MVQINDIGKLYAVNSFFNVKGNTADNMSDISVIEAPIDKSKKSINETTVKGLIELQETIRRNSHEYSSGRFSKILDDLGN